MRRGVTRVFILDVKWKVLPLVVVSPTELNVQVNSAPGTIWTNSSEVAGQKDRKSTQG